MPFNSLAFVAFLPVFLVLYWLTSGRLRLWLTLLASWLFYAWWDWRLLPLLWAQTGTAWWVGRALERTGDPRARKRLFLGGLVAQLAVLGGFKYLDFGVETLRSALRPTGLDVPGLPWHLALPVGISFYTFTCISYLVDVYRRQWAPEPDPALFAASVGLFPNLTAGPIVRSRHLLPQLRVDRRFDLERATDGFQQVLWGFYKKVVVADSLALLAGPWLAAAKVENGASLLVAVYFYSIQIYCDFSGYTDIAIGCGKLLGYDLGVNFDRPYFSRGFAEFWSRWHISLSSWLRDYLFLPIAFALSRRIEADRPLGVRAETWSYLGATTATMLLAGLWHGAAWTFVAWGGLHGLYLVLERLFGRGLNRWATRRRVPRPVMTVLSVLVVFHAVTFAWIFFRSPSFAAARDVIAGIATRHPFALGAVQHRFQVVRALLIVGVVAGVEALSFLRRPYQRLAARPAVRFAAAALVLWCLALFGTFSGASFIYFQF
jgi:alginate O-acetyltransferase complex protein AlgI